MDPRILLWIEAANRLLLEEEETPTPEQPPSDEDKAE